MADELTSVPWSQIAAAILGGLVTFGGTWILQSRKSLTIWRGWPEELTAGLREHDPNATVTVNSKNVTRLNRSRVTVRNSGNSSIDTLELDIAISGVHDVAYTQPTATSKRLSDTISIVSIGSEALGLPHFRVSVPFINPKERLSIDLFYDGEKGECSVDCRIKDVNVKIVKGYANPYFIKRFGFEVEAAAFEKMFSAVAFGLIIILIAAPFVYKWWHG